MLPRLVTLLTLLLILAPRVSGAQCESWLNGALGGPNGTDGGVLAFTNWDPDGPGPRPTLLVAAGGFEHIEGVPAGHIAYRDPNTGRWHELGNPTFPALSVHALTVFGGELIAVGSFIALGHDEANRVARWDGAHWQQIGSGIDNQSVRAVAIYNGELIVAGAFTAAGGQPRNNIARWTGATWEPLGTGTNGVVLALTVFNGELIAGGSFTQAGGVTANRVARWNGSGWQAVGFGMNTSVYGLTVYNGQLIASGAFTTAGGSAASYIARWNGSSWLTLGSGTNNAIRTVFVQGSSLIAGGLFTSAGGVPANSVASWNGVSWSAFGSGITGGPPDVFALGEHNGALLAGGLFQLAGGAPASNIARWTGSAWTSFGGGSPARVSAMIAYNGRLVGGGLFTHSTSSTPASQIVGWDGAQLRPFGTGVNAEVLALESFKHPGISGDYELIAGGSLTSAGGVPASRIARWAEDPLTGFPPPAWQAMGAGFDSEVFAIERFNGRTYAAGSFTFSSGAVSRIAIWNETTDVWESVGTGMNNAVFALKSYGGFLYAGGLFTTAGGVATGGLARWNGTAWSQVGGNFLGSVYALEVHENQLVIAGVFPGINSSPNLARFDGSVYSTFGVGGTNAVVRSLGSLADRLYIGGDFSVAGGMSANRIAYWDGAWHDVAGGADNGVLAFAPFMGEMHVGGRFASVGGGLLPSPTWARHSANAVPWIAYHPASRSATSGEDVALTVEPAGPWAPLAYQWYRFTTPLVDGPTGGGSTIAGATSSTLSVMDATQGDAGHYWVTVANGCGVDTSFTATLTVDGTTDAPGTHAVEHTMLESLGPNPSAGAVRLTFSLARPSEVRVRVHDVGGRLLRHLDVGSLPAGRHHARWDGRADDGRRAGAGVFFVILEVDGRLAGARRLAIVH